MDFRKLLGQLNTISEGTMAAAKKKPTGPKFTGKWKGTDPASAAKDKYVGGSMEESIFKELEETLHNKPNRDIKEEYKKYTANWCGVCGQSPCNCTHVSETTTPRFTELEIAVMEGGHELMQEVAPPTQPGKPTLGADVSQQQQQQQQQQELQKQQQAAQQAAQKQKQEQNMLQKGVNSLKAAGAAISNPQQLATAFNKVDDQQKLNPADRNNIASAGTVLAPIMTNPTLAGKFKDLVAQASTAEKQKQTQTPQTPEQPSKTGQTTTPTAPTPPAGQVK